MKTEKNRLFNLMISDELRKQIRKDAFMQDKSASAVVRDILEKYYSEKETNDQAD